MKKIKKVEIDVCDLCGDDASYTDGCLACGRQFCYECGRDESKVKHYNHATHFSGSGDGYYCLSCDSDLLTEGNNEEHNAYLLIDNLRIEHDTWYARWKDRADAAQKRLEVFVEKRYAQRSAERKAEQKREKKLNEVA